MADCKKCNKSLKNVKAKIECVDCKCMFHAKCVNLSVTDVEYIVAENELWRCDPCGKVRRRSMVMESASTTVTYDDVLKQLQAMSDEFKRVEQSLGRSIDSCHEQIKENIAISKEGKEEIASMKSCMEKLMEENLQLRNKVTFLEAKVEDMEQYSRKNCIEIHGIPEVDRRKETAAETVEIVKRVGIALGFPVEENMIDTCHRLRERSSGKPAGIIVKMIRRIDAESFLQKKREKRDFSTRHLDLPMDQQVYVNESLSAARRRLLYHAKEAKKTKGYKYLWIRGGKILMRKNDNEPVKVITHMDHLNHL